MNSNACSYYMITFSRINLYLNFFHEIINLKEKDSQIFLQQNRFIWQQQRIVIQDMWSNGELHQSPEKQMRTLFNGLINEQCVGN